jgi:hypothetical protein
MWGIMKKLKNFDQFINEELFGLSSEEKRKKADKLRHIQNRMKVRDEVHREENEDLVKTFSIKNEFSIMSLINHIGGGVEHIIYKDDDKIIEKSPLNKRQKEQYDRGKKITYKESQDFRKKLFTTTADDIKVYLIDAEHVRTNIDIDYTMGGHGYIYPNYVPEDEVWIDDRMNELDINATTVHELDERKHMKMMDWTYSKAHEHASKKELEIRKRLEKITN